jgi:hypothetical protein
MSQILNVINARRKMTLEKKVDCYWYPIIKEDKKGYKAYRKQIKNPSEYNCIKCNPKIQSKCLGYASKALVEGVYT